MPRPIVVSALLLALAAPAARAQDAGTLPEAPVRYESDFTSAASHRSRREAVLRALPSRTVAILEGRDTGTGSIDDLQSFAQDPSFFYLTGSEEPGSALLLAPEGVEVDGRRVREILFVPPRDRAQEIWLGRRFGAERARSELGVEMALDSDRFEEIVSRLVTDPATTVLTASDADLRRTIDGLRMGKTDEEMALLRKAIDITAEAHREALRAVRAGAPEYEVEALIEYTFARRGAERPGFPSIVASGENTTTLHYDTNRRTMRSGDLVVLDIGASYHGYTADVTRTLPVDGAFTDEQRRIYALVLEAQKAAIAATRAGVAFGVPGQAASSVLAAGLAELGLIDGPRDADGLARFFPHGTSHYLGLEVHDVGFYGPLAPGQVITVEPGIYIPPAEDIDPKWWNIGVRIEDDVLVTERDAVVLSDGAPKEIADIERAMRSGVTR